MPSSPRGFLYGRLGAANGYEVLRFSYFLGPVLGVGVGFGVGFGAGLGVCAGLGPVAGLG